MSQRPWRRSLSRRRNDGAVFVEAVLVFPVLGILLASVLALNAIYSAKLEAKARARRLAWLTADSGQCPETDCLDGHCNSVAGDVRGNGIDALSSVRTSRFSLDSFVGDLGRFFVGGSTTSVGAATKALPMLFGGTTRQSGLHPLVCNTTPRSSRVGSSILDVACRTDLRHSEYAGEVCD